MEPVFILRKSIHVTGTTFQDARRIGDDRTALRRSAKRRENLLDKFIELWQAVNLQKGKAGTQPMKKVLPVLSLPPCSSRASRSSRGGASHSKDLPSTSPVCGPTRILPSCGQRPYTGRNWTFMFPKAAKVRYRDCLDSRRRVEGREQGILSAFTLGGKGLCHCQHQLSIVPRMPRFPAQIEDCKAAVRWLRTPRERIQDRSESAS